MAKTNKLKVLFLLVLTGCGLTLFGCGSYPANPTLPSKSQLVRFPTIDGAKEPAILSGVYQRVDGNTRPAVIILAGSGGMWTSQAEGAQVKGKMLRLASFFRKKGFHTLIVDSLGSRGISNADIPFTAQRVIDLPSAHAWLESRPEVNPKKIVYAGMSCGAAAALAAANKHSRVNKKPAAIMSFFPYCEPFVGLGHPAWTTRPLSEFETDAPIFIGMGKYDTNVDVGVCQRFVKEYREQGGNIVAKTYEAGHGFFGRPGFHYGPINNVKGVKDLGIRQQIYEDMTTFLNNNVLGVHTRNCRALR